MNIRKDPRSTRPGKNGKKLAADCSEVFFYGWEMDQEKPQDMVSLARHNKDNWGYFMDMSRYI
jgi:hypothetical protein